MRLISHIWGKFTGNVTNLEHMAFMQLDRVLMVRTKIGKKGGKRKELLATKKSVPYHVRLKNNSKCRANFLSLTNKNQSTKTQSAAPIKLKAKSYFLQVMASGAGCSLQGGGRPWNPWPTSRKGARVLGFAQPALCSQGPHQILTPVRPHANPSDYLSMHHFCSDKGH